MTQSAAPHRGPRGHPAGRWGLPTPADSLLLGQVLKFFSFLCNWDVTEETKQTVKAGGRPELQN